MTDQRNIDVINNGKTKNSYQLRDTYHFKHHMVFIMCAINPIYFPFQSFVAHTNADTQGNSIEGFNLIEQTSSGLMRLKHVVYVRPRP